MLSPPRQFSAEDAIALLFLAPFATNVIGGMLDQQQRVASPGAMLLSKT